MVVSQSTFRRGIMPKHLDDQITLFIRDEETGRYAFNARALRTLGVDPGVARELGYPLKDSEESRSSLVA
jgi:hypothetical protein